MLEWPKFKKNIEIYDPLIISIENINFQKINQLDFRKITFFGSENWKDRFQAHNIII